MRGCAWRRGGLADGVTVGIGNHPATWLMGGIHWIGALVDVSLALCSSCRRQQLGEKRILGVEQPCLGFYHPAA